MKYKNNQVRWIAAAVVLVGLVTLLAQCSGGGGKTGQEKITLVMWGVFDESEIYQGEIQAWQSKNRNVEIKYYKIGDDVGAYEDLLVNEIAEGKGPDIFAIKNTWVDRHQGKITPLPEELGVGVEAWKRKFVPVVSEDLVREGEIWGVPLYVDSLALYYNRQQFADYLPSRAKPGVTWDEVKEDTVQMTWEDNSFERFGLAGIALGRTDNIARGVDILLLMMLQNGVMLHDQSETTAIFAQQQNASGENPAKNVVEFFASFANPDYRNYSWNEGMTRNNDAKEIYAFARGKLAMVVGYSYFYESLEKQIAEINKREDVTPIQVSEVGVVKIPQVSEEAEGVTLASYFPYVVSQNSKYPKEAWEFLLYLVEDDNLREYHRQTKKPTPVYNLVEEQMTEAIYGVFAEQSEWAKSYKIWDEEVYEEVLNEMISQINSGRANIKDALEEAQKGVNDYLEAQRIIKQRNE